MPEAGMTGLTDRYRAAAVLQSIARRWRSNLGILFA
jgi:hypothetical protein